MRKRGIRAAVLLAAAAVLCAACNIAAFWIDTPAMRENARQGATMLKNEGASPQLTGGFKSAQLDNFTSVLILKTAAYTGEETLLAKAFGGFRTDMPAQEGQDGWDAFCDYEDGSLSPTGGLSYTRYWHGYTLPLRLLLCVMNLANIEMILLYAQLALFAIVVLLMARRGLGSLIPGFFTAYFLMMPLALGICLQYAPVSLLMLLSCAVLLAWEEPISRGVGLPVYFALVGLLTNYFDLLTFPLVTLGFPLVLSLLMRLRAGDGGRRLLLQAVACCAGWGLGYGGMWALKWVITALMYGWDRLGGILGQAALRVSASSGEASFSRMSVLRMNIAVIAEKSSYLLLLGLTGLASLYPAARALRARRAGVDVRALVMLVPVGVSLAWYLVMANHSYDHTFYTYRNLTCAVFALYALLASAVSEKKRDKN